VEVCQEFLSKSGTDDYYVRATLAEANLLLGNETEASEQLQRAAKLGQRNYGEIATTRKQLKLILRKTGDLSLLDKISLPGVICFSGFPISKTQSKQSLLFFSEAKVRRTISNFLRESNMGFAYGVPNPGAGIVISEEIIDKNAELHLVLPFSLDEYKSLIMERAGNEWLKRFEQCIESAKSITMATEDSYLGDNLLFSYANQFAMGLALLRARYLDTTIEHVAVWEETDKDEPLDNVNDIGKWLSLGLPLETFGFNGEKKNIPSENLRVQDFKLSHGLREPRAMLFGDVKGFSKLREAQLTLFIDTILRSIGEILDEFTEEILYTNTWGDGLFVVFKGVEQAAKCGLKIQKVLKSKDLVSAGLPEDMFIRIGGHFGPIFRAFDPILKKTNYFGTHVSRTARIEPVTPPGEVYVTESFAAQLILNRRSSFQAEYVGNIPTAKSYGNLRMYVLKETLTKSFL
jgi:class 3 adenylate cyclase